MCRVHRKKKKSHCECAPSLVFAIQGFIIKSLLKSFFLVEGGGGDGCLIKYVTQEILFETFRAI